MVTILERGSSRIEFQRDLLEAHYEARGLRPHLAHPKVVKKQRLKFETADFICVPGTYARQTFLEPGVPLAKVPRVPYGASLDQFVPGQKHDDVFRVVRVRACTLQKGCPLLLQAFSELDLPACELHFIARVEAEIAPWIARFADERVTFKGRRPQRKLREYYAQASAFYLVSIHGIETRRSRHRDTTSDSLRAARTSYRTYRS
jgi:hypothetical protein